ncbi:hypothetical protein [Ammoniphilus resinae]|uniref:Uncharacterized protein n=1 Tax=Ammoniphilus resinae TaxID=861532 RepID=A0ABS4GXL4_9BACL|nr:hypothetical protein [Ammoniphilus resinae]MBP1935018.1 hypothetical protein [Ammoniphilus resinae]
MQIKVTMDSGKDYIVVMHIEDFVRMMKNQMGVVVNGFVKVSEGLVINPSHVASVEVIR